MKIKNLELELHSLQHQQYCNVYILDAIFSLEFYRGTSEKQQLNPPQRAAAGCEFVYGSSQRTQRVEGQRAKANTSFDWKYTQPSWI